MFQRSIVKLRGQCDPYEIMSSLRKNVNIEPPKPVVKAINQTRKDDIHIDSRTGIPNY